ncbi:MAG: hypothetical protein ACAH80_10880 [Alphaproteobacteria bacterium]
MNLPGKKSLCKAFAVAAAAVTMTGCAIVPMDPYYPAPVVVVPAPVIVPGPVIYGPVYRPHYPHGHHHPAPPRHHHHYRR